jgi:hypothetical protein
MILGLDDISGGKAIVDFLIWFGLTGLFYIAGYIVALNVIDNITKNSWIKIPVMWSLSFVTSGLMSIFNYNPLILFFIMLVANYFRLKKLSTHNKEQYRTIKVNKTAFYLASYGYIVLVLGITHYIDFRYNL